LTVTVAGSDVVVVVPELVPLEADPPDEEDLLEELDRRVGVLRGGEYVALGAAGAGATTAGVVVAAARSAAEIESRVA
jgi:hypothetical protein